MSQRKEGPSSDQRDKGKKKLDMPIQKLQVKKQKMRGNERAFCM